MVALTYTFRDGTTTTNVIEWARRYEEAGYRIVRQDTTTVDPDLSVSTIWQGLPEMGGEPQVFSTIVCRGLGTPTFQVLREARTANEAAAIAIHELWLSNIANGWDPVEVSDVGGH